MAEVKVRVESIRTDGRFRQDLGDIESLAASMKREGLIHAITVTPDMRLLAGERRLAAARRLGWGHIDARVVNTLDDAAARLRIERDENTERKPMTPEELVALGEALEALERPRAAARKSAGQFGSGRPARTVDAEEGNTRDIVASALGMSATSYRRAKAVVQAANDQTLSGEDRRIAQEALVDMNATGKIAGSYDRIQAGISAKTGAITRPRIETVVGQRRAVGSAETALSGICHGLAQIGDLHPEITSEEAARWMGSLSESRRIITSLINRLKERSNAHT